MGPGLLALARIREWVNVAAGHFVSAAFYEMLRTALRTRRRHTMAKGQMKSNKEKRKPKKEKDDKKAAKK